VILLVAVLAGGFTGWGIARWQGYTWRPPVFHFPGLAVFGFLPQLLAFYLPSTSRLFSNEAASACLIASQAMLLMFAWWNRSLPGMVVLMAGLGCNLTVILANGGFMPLPLETLARLVSQDVLDGLVIGDRIGHSSKDILLPQSSIWLPWLADRFASPSSLPYRFVFSAGDVFIAVGAFMLLVEGRNSSPIFESGDAS
jgi:hypothetical protein